MQRDSFVILVAIISLVLLGSSAAVEGFGPDPNLVKDINTDGASSTPRNLVSHPPKGW